MVPLKKVPYFTKLDPTLREALRRYKVAVGVPEAQQIDRALREWLGTRPEAWTVAEPRKIAARSTKSFRVQPRAKKVR
jgi:hypothetical protein